MCNTGDEYVAGPALKKRSSLYTALAVAGSATISRPPAGVSAAPALATAPESVPIHTYDNASSVGDSMFQLEQLPEAARDK